MADNDDDFYDAVQAMADRLGLDGEDRAKYVHEHMTRGGYDAVPQYVKRQPDPEEEGGGKWSPFASRRQGGDQSGGGGQQRPRSRASQSDGEGWYT